MPQERCFQLVEHALKGIQQVTFRGTPTFCHRQMRQNCRFYRIFVQYFVHERSVYLGFCITKDNKLLSIYRNIKSQGDFISFSDEIVMILVRFIKLLTIFILTGCSCLRSGQGCNIKEIVSETYNNDSIWTIHVVFNGCPDKFQRKQLVNERITKEHPNEVYRISAMKEYNGKMYNNYIYQIIVESK